MRRQYYIFILLISILCSIALVANDHKIVVQSSSCSNPIEYTIPDGAPLTLIANPSYGYQFTQWQDGNTNNPRLLTVTTDATYTAQFAPMGETPTLCTITVQSEECSVPIIKQCVKGFPLTLIANPSYGSKFDKWNDGNKDNPRLVTVTADATYIAQFVKDATGGQPSLLSHQVSFSTNTCDTTWARYFIEGTHLEVHVVPDTICGKFTQWKSGSTNNPLSFIVEKEDTIIAEFGAKQYTISTSATNGTITGGGKYDCNAMATLTAVPNEGYYFYQWSDGNISNPRQLVVTQDSTFTAEFLKKPVPTLIADVSVYGDCDKNGYTKEIIFPVGVDTVLNSSGRTACEWVQLWENGPKWAAFNVGSTIMNYAKLVVGADPTVFKNHTDQVAYYNTTNVGGLYPWRNPNLNGRKTSWTGRATVDISDVATTLWGNKWATPTKPQLDSLMYHATWTWCNGSTTQYEEGCTLQGYKISGKGDYANFSIFLPAAGCFSTVDNGVCDVSSTGYYWSNTRFNYTSYAYYVYFISSSLGFLYVGSKLFAQSVRAIMVGHTDPPEKFTLSLNANDCELTNEILCTKEQPLRITAVSDDCKRFTRWSDGNTDNPRIVTITSDSTFTAIFEQMPYTIQIKSTDGNIGKVGGEIIE